MTWKIEEAGGNCPWQAEGTVVVDDGVERVFYFRARGMSWSFDVYHPDEPKYPWLRNTVFSVSSIWGLEQYDSGYIPDDVGMELLEDCLALYTRSVTTSDELSLGAVARDAKGAC
jgi:hypothetical protein